MHIRTLPFSLTNRACTQNLTTIDFSLLKYLHQTTILGHGRCQVDYDGMVVVVGEEGGEVWGGGGGSALIVAFRPLRLFNFYWIKCNCKICGFSTGLC